jgi:tetratricopeptide (TPR) repeat protein
MGVFDRTWKWVVSRLYVRLADAHRHMGNLYANAQEHRAAVGNYTRAIRLDPTYSQALFSRGLIYWRELGNYDGAVEDLTRVLELDPRWAEAYFNRAIAYRMRGEADAAITDLESYLAEGSDPFWLESAARQLEELRADAEGSQDPVVIDS